MATISDDLAKQIQQAFDQYQQDTGNQNSFFFGTNTDVTILKPDGTTAKVASVAKILALIAAAQKKADDTSTALGTTNTTLAKAGRTDQANTWGELQTYTKGATFNGTIISRNALEIYHATPFIDFHFGNSAADYTARIIQSDANTLSILGTHLNLARDLYVAGTVFNKNDFITNRTGWSGTVGTVQSAAAYRSRMEGRGGFGDAAGAWGGFYFEEQVGTEHRLVFMMDGFGKNTTMIFRPDRSLEMDTIRLNNGRTTMWTALNGDYVEFFIDGTARGINFFTSDERLKEKIEDVKPGSASDAISQLRPVSYRFRDTEFNKGRSYSFGVIAQEAEKVLPDLVQTMSDGFKSLNPLAVMGLLLAHNKELEGRLSALEARLPKE